jgi:hypothetical protein
MVTSLDERLRRRSWKVFNDAVRDTVMEAPLGEVALVAALDDFAKSRQVAVVAVLGDARGTEGPSALRKILSSIGVSRDMRCAAALALAKRCGTDASADLARALFRRDGVVKQYAVMGLAGAGDDRAWEQVFTRLKQLLRQPGPPPRFSLEYLSLQSPAATAICYLGRHLDGAGGDRSVRLVRELRGCWERLGSAEQEWLNQIWPGSAPSGPHESEVEPPDKERMERWIRDPLFGPVL